MISLLFCVAASSITTGTLLGFFHAEAPATVSDRTLTFEERVAYQRAIEDVYWRHRIWPGERSDPKPSLDAVMSQEQLEKKVKDYLRNSQALEDYWQRPPTAEHLQAEMDRMAKHSNQPQVLHELFEALGNDPFVIAECLARPVLAERLFTDLSAQDKTSHSHSARPNRLRVMPMATTLRRVGYTLPRISEGAPPCVDDTWTPTSTVNAPAAREEHTAVWTGSEMIVWGGLNNGTSFNTGGRFNPGTDSWTATNTTGAPAGRYGHTAVWTGSEMIVWGGLNDTGYLNSGGRYNPTTDSWTPTSTTNTPAARRWHTSVWTGSEMIVWGGYNNGTIFNTGGRYNPGTDSWTATCTTNAPAAREEHTAVWTGSEMIVWGGFGAFGVLNTGGRYNPSTECWTATSLTNAPSARAVHTAVWNDSEMVVWGGFDLISFLNTGSKYNPGSDSWTATTTMGAPSARILHTAIWSSSQMIIWGGRGSDNDLNTGGRYDPSTDSWTSMSTTNAPAGRELHTAVWTDNEMIVWGGTDNASFFNTGGRYCAQSGPPTITLSAAGRKVQGINTVRLTWSGATSVNIDVYRNGMPIARTANDGSYTDSTGDTGRARYRYRVCEAGTATCSNAARVTFRQ